MSDDQSEPFNYTEWRAKVDHWLDHEGGREKLKAANERARLTGKALRESLRITPEIWNMVVDYQGPDLPRAQPIITALSAPRKTL